MTNRILVTTDLSTNSRAGVRFAIQLAAKTKSSLIFYHCIELLKPTRLGEEKYQSYRSSELASAQGQLIKFVNRIYDQLGVRKTDLEYVVQEGSDARASIIEYATKIKAGAICMSTRGAGRFKKLIGTNASAILTSSPIPVFVIPHAYKRAPLSTVFYASDLNDLQWELKQVKEFATGIKARIAVHNYDYLLDVEGTKAKLLKTATRFKTPGVKFVFQKLNIENTLASHLVKDIRKSKPSVAVLFTNQKRGWFDKLFLSSKTADVSFDSKVPLLVYPKR